MQERAKKTRELIMSTALAMFAEKGFHGTKVDAIATAAKVNKQRIYAYFGSKSGLFEQCLVTVFAEVNRFERETLGLNIDNIFCLSEVLLREYMDLHDKYPQFQRMLTWANLEGTEFVDKLLDIKSENFKKVRVFFVAAQQNGFVRQDIIFETYIFNIMAAAWFYHSNRLTLSRTLSDKLFTVDGREQFIREAANQLSGI
ncbi:MAG: TetR/AcrR family transcriptional regulator [Victivallaceae bacterium]|nr:TetR/AcrR family transcriptional regulator [Victivallaceae bacterium]